ncbi:MULTISPECIES: glycosyltransferase [Winogradskyella]|uniref:glycosyltransferase n=1 Tax=Winogradskyella TaxID=286104 RepID=UPI0015CBEF7E|nr:MULTISPECIES: glycosyltransferase [Winogradskyella]QXP80031.1 glycosyltransferase [Winogradskyella sp. HaHa_3_26]
MKIGIISIMEGYPWGGSEELWYNMALQAVESNHEVLVSYKLWDELPENLKILQEKYGVEILTRNNRTIYPSVWQRGLGKLMNKASENKRINNFEDIIDRNPDILFINEGAFTSILHFPDLYNLLLQNSIPYIILSHQNREYGAIPEDKFLLANKIYQNAKKVLFVSERNREMADILLAKSLKNSKVVLNPVNLTKVEKLPFPVTTIMKLATVGRLQCAQKGHDILLRALSKLKSKFNFQLTFYGTGEDEFYLKQLTKYLDLEAQVIFAGYEKDVRSIWKDNQLLVLSSHYEGMPLVVVEAMLCGRACVVTDVAGHSEWINDKVNGFISKTPNVNELKVTLETAFNNFKSWETMGKVAFEVATNKYSNHPGQELLKTILD